LKKRTRERDFKAEEAGRSSERKDQKHSCTELRWGTIWLKAEKLFVFIVT